MERSSRIEAYLMSLLASRLGSISVQMNNAIVKSARSSVLSLARDCSTAILDKNGDVLTFPAGFPVHVGGSSIIGKHLLETRGDTLKPGDAYLNNSPYHGNTHAADYTILVPVFYEGELMFITMCKGHLADCGNSIPTTYNAWARDVYEEGALIFPCVQVQENYQDNQDIINICKVRIRVPEVWYGDYTALIGAARIGERELADVIEKYGADLIKEFCDEYQEYGKRRMVEEIKKLPKGKVYYETTHDPIPEVLPNGVTVKVTVTVDPEEGRVVCDFSENEDSQPCGVNLSESTLTSAARTGILNRLGVSVKDFPCCEGALGRIEVIMREGSIVGKAKHPFSSSVCTTNVNDRAVAAVQCSLNGLTDYMGMAEPHYELGLSHAVISGKDTRHNGREFVTQIIGGTSGGPGLNGYDGHMFYELPTGGLHFENSIEMVERNYPILYIKQEIVQDRMGFGKWDGAPCIQTTIRTLDDPVTFVHTSDGHFNVPKGADGGHDGFPVEIYLAKVKVGNEIEISQELPTINRFTLKVGEAVDSYYSSSGGYGSPGERDPELIRHRVREGWISEDVAKEIYGVVIKKNTELYSVDIEATDKLREKLSNKKG